MNNIRCVLDICLSLKTLFLFICSEALIKCPVIRSVYGSLDWNYSFLTSLIQARSLSQFFTLMNRKKPLKMFRFLFLFYIETTENLKNYSSPKHNHDFTYCIHFHKRIECISKKYSNIQWNKIMNYFKNISNFNIINFLSQSSKRMHKKLNI